MLTDPKRLKEIRAKWDTVRIFEARIGATLSCGIFSVVPAATNFREIPESLLLLFATTVLQETLKALADQRVFKCKSWNLEALMKSSRDPLNWRDYEKVDGARKRRNAVAHHHVFLRTGECGFSDGRQRIYRGGRTASR